MKNIENSRNAAEITLNKVNSYEELNALTEKEGDEKFSAKTRELWKEFAVSGVVGFDKKTGQRKVQSYTDLDGRTTMELLKMAGINVSDLRYIEPGKTEKGRINFDTGDKLGVDCDKESDTAILDHHVSDSKTVTSTAEIMYNVLSDLKLIEKNEALDRVVDFVTKMDNKQIPAEEFLKSGKTIIGIQRHIDFEKLLNFFKDHKSPFDELTPEEFEKYELRQPAEAQQKIVDFSMQKLEEMEQAGKIVNTKYGSLVINVNNELPVGSSAAYIRHDGIINFTPGKSFAITMKEKDLDGKELQEKFGDKFQGKIIRGKMWIYNDKEPLKISIEDLIDCLK